MPCSCSAIASSALVTCSPVAIRTSTSRSAGCGAHRWASSSRRFVSPDIADTTTTNPSPARCDLLDPLGDRLDTLDAADRGPAVLLDDEAHESTARITDGHGSLPPPLRTRTSSQPPNAPFGFQGGDRRSSGRGDGGDPCSSVALLQVLPCADLIQCINRGNITRSVCDGHHVAAAAGDEIDADLEVVVQRLVEPFGPLDGADPRSRRCTRAGRVSRYPRRGRRKRSMW